MLAKIEKGLYHVLKVFTELLVLVLVIMVAGQILSRELALRWLATPDEVVTMVFAWLAFFGSALLVRDNGHLRAGVLDDFLAKRPRLQKPYRILIDGLLLFFEVIFFRSGLVLFHLGTIKRSPQLQWPQTIWYFPVLAAAVLMLFYTVVRLAKTIFGHGSKTAN